MKAHRICKSAVLGLVLGVLISLFVVPMVIAGVTVTSINHSENSHTSYWPEINGTQVVYSDDINGNYDIYLYDTVAKTTTQLTHSTTGADAPNIDDQGGHKLVYTRNNGDSTTSIVLLDFTDPTNPVSTDLVSGLSDIHDDWGHIGRNRPDISGNMVVYRSNSGRIYKIDLAAGAPYTPVQISPNGETCYRATISGNYVTYHVNDADGSGHYGVVLYNMTSGSTIIISDVNYEAERPNIAGNVVVYNQYYDDGSGSAGDHVIMYDIATQVTKEVSAAGEDSWWANTDGEKIVYTRTDSVSNEQVFTYDIATGKESMVSDDTVNGDPGFPAVSGNNVVFIDDQSSGDYEVYVSTIAGPAFVNLPGSSTPINITEGQVITSNPYIIQVLPTDTLGILRVEFYVDGVLIGTSTTPDANGVYSWPWDTSLYHSLVKVVAYNNVGLSIEITRNTTVALELPYTGR